MRRALLVLVIAVVTVGVAGELRRLTWSGATLIEHARRAGDALTAARRAADHTGHLRPSEAEQVLHAAAAGGAGLAVLRRKVAVRALASAGVLALLALIALALRSGKRFAPAAAVAACGLVAAGALASLLPAWRAWRNVPDAVVAWEIAELVALAALALAAVVVGMLSTSRRPAAG